MSGVKKVKEDDEGVRIEVRDFLACENEKGLGAAYTDLSRTLWVRPNQLKTLLAPSNPHGYASSPTAIRVIFYIRKRIEEESLDASFYEKTCPNSFKFTEEFCKTYPTVKEREAFERRIGAPELIFAEDIPKWVVYIGSALMAIRQHYALSLRECGNLFDISGCTASAIEHGRMQFQGSAVCMRYACTLALKFVRDFCKSGKRELDDFCKSQLFDETRFFLLWDYVGWVLSL